MIAHGIWSSRFGGNAAVLGQMIDVDGRAVRIVGVLPQNFELPSLAQADILRPRQPDPRAQGNPFLHVFARLKPRPAWSRFTSSPSSPFPRRSSRTSASQTPEPGHRRPALLLLTAVGFVLLSSIANVANILIARAASRHRELAVRAAMGAGAGRLLRQSLTGSLLLSAIGGAAGAGLAAATAPAGIARLDQAALDGRVPAATIGISLMAGLLFGLAPAPQRPSLESLTGGRIAGRRRQWLRPTLVVVQIALSLVLLCGAGLPLEALQRPARHEHR